MSAQTPQYSPQQRLHKIVEDGMCIGCGLCQAVAGPDKVKAVKVTSGHIRPVPAPGWITRQ